MWFRMLLGRVSFPGRDVTFLRAELLGLLLGLGKTRFRRLIAVIARLFFLGCHRIAQLGKSFQQLTLWFLTHLFFPLK
jgi:hypothetical protein